MNEAIPLPAERESLLRAAVRRYLKVADYWCGIGRAQCRDECPRHKAQREIEKLLIEQTEIGKPRSSGSPHNDEGIPM